MILEFDEILVEITISFEFFLGRIGCGRPACLPARASNSYA
jgi:hypothetical protein